MKYFTFNYIFMKYFTFLSFNLFKLFKNKYDSSSCNGSILIADNVSNVVINSSHNWPVSIMAMRF